MVSYKGVDSWQKTTPCEGTQVCVVSKKFESWKRDQTDGSWTCGCRSVSAMNNRNKEQMVSPRRVEQFWGRQIASICAPDPCQNDWSVHCSHTQLPLPLSVPKKKSFLTFCPSSQLLHNTDTILSSLVKNTLQHLLQTTGQPSSMPSMLTFLFYRSYCHNSAGLYTLVTPDKLIF